MLNIKDGDVININNALSFDDTKVSEEYIILKQM